MAEAVQSMTMLNKTAAEISRKYQVHACTDVTGFGFLGHLHEMLDGNFSCQVVADQVPLMQNVLAYADEFYLTAAAQKNRNHVEQYVQFENIPFAMEEVLFDPQISGGLLLAVDPADAETMLQEMQAAGLPAAIVGEIREKNDFEIYVK
jgi:selenide,water dikinase